MPTNPRIPIPFLGADVVAGTIWGLDVAIDGVLSTPITAGTYCNFLAAPPDIQNVGRRVSVVDTPGNQEINAMNTQQRNQVIIDRGATLDIQIFNVNNGTDPSPLTSLVQNFDYFYVEWLEGEAANQWTNQFYGVRAELDHPLEGRGEQLTTLHLNECDPGWPTIPQYYRYLSG